MTRTLFTITAVVLGGCGPGVYVQQNYVQQQNVIEVGAGGGASAASAERAAVPGWNVVAGWLASAGDGRHWIGTSNAAQPPASWSFAQFQFPREVPPRFEMTVTAARRTSDTNRPIELYFLGGAFGVNQNGSWYLWETDSHWTGWVRSDAIHDGENVLAVVQRGRTVEGYVNGTRVGSFELELEPVPGRVSVFFKGDPGVPSRVEFADFALRELEGG